MTTGCVNPVDTTYVPGTDLTGIPYTVGVAGGTYFVTLTVNSSTGYLGSSTPSASMSHADTSKVGVPGTPTGANGLTTGSLTLTFGAPTGVAPASYSVEACTGPNGSGTCTTPSAIVSGGQLTGLQSGTRYYLQVTDIGPTGFVNNVSAWSGTSYRAR